MAMTRLFTVLFVAYLGVYIPVLCDTDNEFEQNLRDALNFINVNETLQAALDDHMKMFGSDYKMLQSGQFQSPLCPTCPPKYKWPCKIEKSSGAKPTSVHKLRPSDIDVVGAIGDSITAANGLDALTILGVLINYRGKSWSIGGVEDIRTQFTFPNILKQYNPNLKGYSTGIGRYKDRNAHLNLAVAGAKSEDMLTQAIRLVERMRQTTDFENDWKVVTLFIGGNDLCASCKEPAYYKASYYTDRIKNALDLLHKEVPRAFVNVVPTIDGSFVDRLNIGLICSVVHRFVCKCGAYPKDDKAKADLRDLVVEYQQTLTALIETGRYDTRDDFTVVIQPFFEETTLPMKSDGSADLSYFAPDCFHFSRKGHRSAAEALWNNMVEPVGHKRRNWKPDEQVVCPSEYFYTYKNSKLPSVGQSRNQLLGAQLSEDSQHLADSGHDLATSPGIIVGSLFAVFVVLAFVGTLVFARQRKRKESEEREALFGKKDVAYS